MLKKRRVRNTNITTTRNTRKPDHHWRWWRRTQQKKRQLLYCGVDLFHTSLFPLALSRMHQLTTSILWMSTVHMQSLLLTSTNALSIWLSWQILLKPVTSTIVGDIVTNSFLLYHVLTIPFTLLFHLWSTCIFFEADMPLYTHLPRFYFMFYMCLPQGKLRWLYSLAIH